MIRLFKKISFVHGTLVEVTVSDEKHKQLIIDIMDLCVKENMISMGHGKVAPGSYSKFHRKDDARIIKRFVNEWTKNKKAEIQKQKRRF